jgi:hypothetical protein
MIDVITNNNIVVTSLLSDFFNSYDIEVLGNDWDSIEHALDTIDDKGYVHEHVDVSIDIYTASLWKWAADNYDNYEYVEQAIDEGLVSFEDFSMIGALQAGQYVQINEKFYTELGSLREILEDIYNN